MTDVRDTVRAYAIIAGRGRPGRAYNVCSGRVVAIREMLQARAGQASIAGSRLVLVVDQFEETFTACDDEQERCDQDGRRDDADDDHLMGLDRDGVPAHRVPLADAEKAPEDRACDFPQRRAPRDVRGIFVGGRFGGSGLR